MADNMEVIWLAICVIVVLVEPHVDDGVPGEGPGCGVGNVLTTGKERSRSVGLVVVIVGTLLGPFCRLICRFLVPFHPQHVAGTWHHAAAQTVVLLYCIVGHLDHFVGVQFVKGYPCIYRSRQNNIVSGNKK